MTDSILKTLVVFHLAIVLFQWSLAFAITSHKHFQLLGNFVLVSKNKTYAFVVGIIRLACLAEVGQGYTSEG